MAIVFYNGLAISDNGGIGIPLLNKGEKLLRGHVVCPVAENDMTIQITDPDHPEWRPCGVALEDIESGQKGLIGIRGVVYVLVEEGETIIPGQHILVSHHQAGVAANDRDWPHSDEEGRLNSLEQSLGRCLESNVDRPWAKVLLNVNA